MAMFIRSPWGFLLNALFCGALLCLEACSVGPNYKRPAVTVPAAYRGASVSEPPTTASVPTSPNVVRSLGAEKWWEVFEDKELQSLIRTALKNNYDVRIAAARVLEAQAQLGITRADQFPSLSAGGNITACAIRRSARSPVTRSLRES
jgi:outer membrane protein, multidrug efflux system